MPITIQVGDIANRLRRAFDIRGRIPTSLDETIVPVAIVRNADELPFALDPAGVGGFFNLTPTAGQQATLGISNQGPKGSVFILDELYLASQTAGNRLEVSRSGVLQTDGVFTDKSCADMSTSCLGLITALSVPVTLRGWTTAPAGTGGAIAQELRVLTTHAPFSIRAMLRRGEVIYVKCQTVTQDLYVAVKGRFYTAAAFDQ